MVTKPNGGAIIGEDLIVKGEIRSGGRIEVRGYIEGSVSAEHVSIQPGGRVFGTLTADSAEVFGTMQGKVAIKQLINIGSTGVVSGDVRYGRLSMAAGGDLSADVRNVPPEITGDFHLIVRRSRSVSITTTDLTAFDPDDTSEQLVYAVTQPVNGYVSRTAAPTMPIDRFTQAELAAGGMLFVHDGSSGANASFDVVVSDHAGASSGAPRTVTVAVIDPT
jgi:cytoskeletal protein CcmA (bactofilin family)